MTARSARALAGALAALSALAIVEAEVGVARADATLVSVRADTTAARARRGPWARWAERAAARDGRASTIVREDEIETWAIGLARARGNVDPTGLDALDRIEELLVAARRDAVALRERRALAELASAERIIVAHADVPGAAAWYAEIETAIGLTAAQVGLDELSNAALLRAATLDPSRGVRAAEAAPPIVDRAAALARRIATGPTGAFAVRADANGARVIVDDEDLGAAPRVVRASVGRHVLRVEADGYKPYGAVIDVLEGERLPIEIALDEEPLLASARALRDASRRADARRVTASLAALLDLGAPIASAWLVEVGGGPQDRALVMRCDRDRCSEPRRMEARSRTPAPGAFARSTSGGADATRLASARAWLREERSSAPTLAWWERWYVWVGVAVLASAAAIGIYAVTRPPPEQQLRIVIDPGEAAPVPPE